MQALITIDELKNGNVNILKKEKWLRFLALTKERNINLERVASLEEMNNNYVFEYVEKSLKVLEKNEVDDCNKYIIEEALKWSEVSKAGLPHNRKAWIKKGINLFAHNIGSAQIYLQETDESDDRIKRIVHDLILTHGLIGQYLRGEVSLDDSKSLYVLITEKIIDSEELKEILNVFNHCIVAAVSEELWNSIGPDIKAIIEMIIEGHFEKQYSIKERIKRLRTVSIKNGENFELEYQKMFSNNIVKNCFEKILSSFDTWYVEAAFFDFSFEEFVKVFLITYEFATKNNINSVKHLSFENFMKELYYQHDGKKRVNIYKKRIIEKYLSDLSVEDILSGNFKPNMHLEHEVLISKELDDTVFFNFKFSKAAAKLIEFCTEAEKSDVLYENAIILLFDLFGLRKDKYDRFYEEESYLSTMNQTIDYKKIILNYIKGNSIIDIGPGGGALMDLIEDNFPDKIVRGVDISQNVIDTLKKKKQLENRKWDVLYGDALNLKDYIEKNSVNTIIFCSILHELFSYIEYNGKKFNYETLAAAFKSAFEVIPTGGRIIIRDGIMSEPENQKRIIKFLSKEGMEFLERYAQDFKGREIQYSVIGHNEVNMPINDAMEFLYTYTWGEKSYVHEINEQFGYFTPNGVKEFIAKELGERAKIIEFKHFLQQGYTVALSQKIEFFDESKNKVSLPDSTCLIVIEKI